MGFDEIGQRDHGARMHSNGEYMYIYIPPLLTHMGPLLSFSILPLTKCGLARRRRPQMCSENSKIQNSKKLINTKTTNDLKFNLLKLLAELKL